MLQNTLQITFSFYCQIENKSLHLPDITVSHNEARICVCVVVVVQDRFPAHVESEAVGAHRWKLLPHQLPCLHQGVCVHVCVCVREKCFY